MQSTNETANEIHEMAKAFSHRHNCKIKHAAQKYRKDMGEKTVTIITHSERKIFEAHKKDVVFIPMSEDEKEKFAPHCVNAAWQITIWDEEDNQS